MDEFALIRCYFAGLTAARDGVVLGIGDDAALLQTRPGHELVVTTDTLIAGCHFPPETAPADIGWKTLAVNLSDLAAMGAEPRWFTLSLSLPAAEPRWLTGFCSGLKTLAERYGIALVGGDTTRGALSITITALGEVPAGRALRRSGARIGDSICVTGTLGDAAAALVQWSAGAGTSSAGDAEAIWLRQRLDRPEPRLAAGQALRGLAHAAIDLSDGLVGDLQHILDASGVGAEVLTAQLPMSAAFRKQVPEAARLRLQIAGGDDYELCVCMPAQAVDAARTLLDVPLTVIGRITGVGGLRMLGADGATIASEHFAYRHFE